MAISSSPDDTDSKFGPETDVNWPYGLNDGERMWNHVDYNVLHKNGYELKPRLRPGWVGSWVGTSLRPEQCEDSVSWKHAWSVVPAHRISDGLPVMVKRICTGRENDLEAAKFYDSDEMRRDPDNHCVPLLDVIRPIPILTYLILPTMREFNDPDFETLGEILDFIKQMLVGLDFMHRHNLAHGDIAMNILMDPVGMFPNGYNPVQPSSALDKANVPVSWRPRMLSSPRYYFIDFERSVKYNSYDERGLVVGTNVHAKGAPELSRTVPYDPFPMDVFALGAHLETLIIDRYPSTEFLRLLTSAMWRGNPKTRPTAAHSLKVFNTFVRDLSPWTLHAWRGWRSDMPVRHQLRLFFIVSVAYPSIYYLLLLKEIGLFSTVTPSCSQMSQFPLRTYRLDHHTTAYLASPMDVELNETQFNARVKRIYDGWNDADDNEDYESIKDNDALFVLTGDPADEDESMRKAASFHQWLLGYEFPSILILFEKQRISILCSSTKARILSQFEGTQGTVPVEIFAQAKIKEPANDALWKFFERYVSLRSIGTFANEKHSGKLVEEWKWLLSEAAAKPQISDMSPAVSSFMAVKDEEELTK